MLRGYLSTYAKQSGWLPYLAYYHHLTYGRWKLTSQALATSLPLLVHEIKSFINYLPCWGDIISRCIPVKVSRIEQTRLNRFTELSNIRSLYRDQLVYGERLWQRFNQKDKQEHYWYYKRIAECLTELKNHCAYAEYAGLVEKTFKE